jgi:hypothetical protein
LFCGASRSQEHRVNPSAISVFVLGERQSTAQKSILGDLHY